jgi:K(+)-stimulated pyrophosphate-energized sodium pump
MGTSGRTILLVALLIAFAGIGFGVIALIRSSACPAHRSMTEISQLIWETCKTYLFTQGKYLLWLELLIGTVIVLYFGILRGFPALKVVTILAFSAVGIAGSYGVLGSAFAINTYANSRTCLREPFG